MEQYNGQNRYKFMLAQARARGMVPSDLRTKQPKPKKTKPPAKAKARKAKNYADPPVQVDTRPLIRKYLEQKRAEFIKKHTAQGCRLDHIKSSGNGL